MPGVMPMKANNSSGWRRLSLVKSAALRSGAATIALIWAGVSVWAEAAALNASASRIVRPSFMDASRKPRQCPACGIAHQRRIVVQQLLNGRQRGLRTAVAQRIGDVAHEAVAADALDRGAGEALAEGGLVECCEFGQPRRAEIGARRKCHLVRALGELVPWASGEAVVAAVDAIAEQRPQLFVDRAFMLD